MVNILSHSVSNYLLKHFQSNFANRFWFATITTIFSQTLATKIGLYIAFDILDAFSEAYDLVSDVLASCQLAAFLEVIHPMVGIVKTGILAPFMQVYFKVYN